MRPRRHSPTIALALALLVALLHLAGCESREPAGTSDAGTVTLDTLSADADAAHPADADAGADSAAPLAWGPCDLTKWSGTYPAPGPGVTIECTTVAVPLDHAAPEDGRRVSLMVARQLAAQPTSPRRALFFLAGGPGGSSVETSGTIPLYVAKLAETFDLYYIDQRGTGESGFLGCQSSQNAPRDESEWRACAAEHDAARLVFYGTDSAARDIELVRARLGYAQISLRGGSYGTRLALEYMRLYPARVRAAVLDGVLAADTDILSESIGTFDRGMKLLVDDCRASSSCSALCPDLAADVAKVRADLAANPALIKIGTQQALLGDSDFMSIVQNALYRAALRFRLPRAVCTRARGDGRALDQLLSLLLGQTVSGTVDPAPLADKRGVRRLAGVALEHLARLPLARVPLAPLSPRGPVAVAPGLQQTIFCREWMPLGPGVDALAALQSKQTYGSLGESLLPRVRACDSWSVGQAPAALGKAVVSDVPTLLLSGALDLQTYPEWGDQAAKTLSHAKHVVIPHATHSTISVPCAAQLMTSFLVAGSVQGLDTSCVGAISAPAW
ncbi:MAG: alpha/beta fold hydrolase [Myxococcales bacterium]|nr:alpha/beta fold hydrolase [Myxococcales bacterium]